MDGSRVNAIIPPLALQGPTLTIRKFSKRRLIPDDLINFGSINQNMVEFLKLSVHQRRNIVISGGTGSGKTTLLNIMSAFIPEDERIVTVEDSAELSLPQEHVVSLESRPPNIEGKGAITIRDLVKNCLRMRPDRIVVGECRGGEALDMLQAMNTGHDGSITTAHANSPRDAISRLETMVLMAGMDLPIKAIRQQISSAVNLIVQQSRMPDGSRKITYITEVTGMEGEIITLQEIFKFQQKGFDSDGKVVGEFQATGIIPNFVHELKKRGISVDLTMFENERGNK
jgi:pilus assembly protein CpaF